MSTSGTDLNQRHGRPAAPSSLAPAGPWANLPDALLLSVLDLLPSIRDLFAVTAVCRSWRTVSRRSLSYAAGGCPPLLLLPDAVRLPRRSYQRRWRWADDRRRQSISFSSGSLLCPAEPSAPSRYMLSVRTLGVSLLGSSYGHLIFCDGRRVILADPFTGDELRPPDLPGVSRHFYHGALTAPLSFPGSHLLLSAEGNLLRWRVGDSNWDEYSFTPLDVYMYHMVALKDQVFALDNLERLHVLQFSPCFSIKQLAVQWAGKSISLDMTITFSQQLIECSGELMLVRVVPVDEIMYLKFEVYRLDLSGQPTWVKVDSLGDWALFLDEAGRCAASCACPGRWGGRSNCIYYACQGCDDWYVLSLDDTAIDTSDPECPLCLDNVCFSTWPSRIWVYPSILF